MKGIKAKSYTGQDIEVVSVDEGEGTATVVFEYDGVTVVDYPLIRIQYAGGITGLVKAVGQL